MKNQVRIIAVFVVFTSSLTNSAQRHEAMLTLIAVDGETSFKVPLEIARESLFINDYLSSYGGHTMGWEAAADMPTQIPAPLLKYFGLSLLAFHLNKELKGRVLFDEVYQVLAHNAASGISADAAERFAQALHISLNPTLARLQNTLPFGLCLALFKIAHQYEFAPLFHLMGRELISFSLAAPDLFKVIKQRMPSGGVWERELARWHYLLTGEDITGIDPESISFSIRELLDYHKLEEAKGDIGALNLVSNRIALLEGFDDLPNIKQVSIVSLSNNHIRFIPKGFFNAFINIKELVLSRNRIEVLEPNCFPPNLETLSMGENRIKTLDTVGVFPQKLQELGLNTNKISLIVPGVFPNSLRFLTLDGNTTLRDLGFLALLSELQEVALRYMNISYVDPAWFPSSLQEIALNGNSLSKENYVALKAAFPNVVIRLSQ